MIKNQAGSRQAEFWLQAQIFPELAGIWTGIIDR